MPGVALAGGHIGRHDMIVGIQVVTTIVRHHRTDDARGITPTSGAFYGRDSLNSCRRTAGLVGEKIELEYGSWKRPERLSEKAPPRDGASRTKCGAGTVGTVGVDGCLLWGFGGPLAMTPCGT